MNKWNFVRRPTYTNATYGMFLRYLREKQGLTMKEVAKKLGYPYGKIGYLERGEHRITMDVYERYLRAIGLSMRTVQQLNLFDKFISESDGLVPFAEFQKQVEEYTKEKSKEFGSLENKKGEGSERKK